MLTAGPAARRRCRQTLHSRRRARSGGRELSSGSRYDSASQLTASLLPPPAPLHPGGLCSGARLQGRGSSSSREGVSPIFTAIEQAVGQPLYSRQEAHTGGGGGVAGSAAARPPGWPPCRSCWPGSAGRRASLQGRGGYPQTAGGKGWDSAWQSVPAAELPHTHSRISLHGMTSPHQPHLRALIATHRQAGRSTAPS